MLAGEVGLSPVSSDKAPRGPDSPSFIESIMGGVNKRGLQEVDGGGTVTRSPVAVSPGSPGTLARHEKSTAAAGSASRLGEMLGYLRERRKTERDERGPWSPVQEGLRTGPKWTTEEAPSPFRVTISPPQRTPKPHMDEIRRAVQETMLRTRNADTESQDGSFTSSIRGGGGGGGGVSSPHEFRSPSPYTTPNTRRPPSSPAIVPNGEQRSFTKSDSATRKDRAESTPRRRGIRAPDSDDEDDATTAREVQRDASRLPVRALYESSDEAHRVHPDFVVVGALPADHSASTSGGHVVWIEAESDHLRRVRRFVNRMHANRLDVEAHLRSQIVDVELQHMQRTEGSRHCVEETLRRRDEARQAYTLWRRRQTTVAEGRKEALSRLASARRVKEEEQRRRDDAAALAADRKRQEEDARRREEAERQRRKADEEEKQRVCDAARQEAKAKEERAASEREKQQRETESAAAAQKKVTFAPSGAASKGVEEEYLRLQAQLVSVETLADKFRNDASKSRMRIQVKKGVNLAINQIAASQKQVYKVSNDLQHVLAEASKLGEEAIAFAENTIAERIVAEGRSQVMLHVHSSFAIAAVAVALISSYAQLGPILLAHFHRSCCLTVPRYIPRKKGQSNDEYRRALGYLEDETMEAYYLRMSGYVSLYAAVVQTDLSPQVGVQNPIGIAYGWKWLAAMANMKPKRITATAIIAFLEIAGFEMHRHYGRQFSKLLRLIVQEVLPLLPADAPPGASSRVTVYVEDHIYGRLQPPKGKVLPASDAENN